MTNEHSAPQDWLADLSDDLCARLRFLVEADRLKSVVRANRIIVGGRFENAAEHSWHLALFTMILADLADDKVDTKRVMQMAVLHDLVELDCGDAPLHDHRANARKAEREAAAAKRIFGLLSPPQGTALLALWREFEASETPDAKFANALDRLISVILIHANRGDTWAAYSVDASLVRAKSQAICAVSSELESVFEAIMAEAIEGGWPPSSSSEETP